MKGMQSWVVTGGVACGKSVVMDWLAANLGPRMSAFSCDTAVHELYQETAVQEQMAGRFGTDVLESGAEGTINKEFLRELVLADPVARRDLEAILHPPVLARLEAARAAAKAGTVNLFVAEVPLHYEIGATVAADHVIVVASSPALQVRRLMQHRGLDQVRCEALLAAQWPILDKAANASVVIWNDGTLETLEDQAEALTHFLTKS